MLERSCRRGSIEELSRYCQSDEKLMERAEQLAIATAAGVPGDYSFLSSSLTLHRSPCS